MAATPVDPSKLNDTFLMAHSLSSNGGGWAAQLLDDGSVQVTVNGVTGDGLRVMIVQRLRVLEATVERLDSNDSPDP